MQPDANEVIDYEDPVVIIMVDPHTLAITELNCIFVSNLDLIREEMVFIVNRTFKDYIGCIGDRNHTPIKWLDISAMRNTWPRFYFCAKCGQPITQSAGCRNKTCVNPRLPLFGLPNQPIPSLNMNLKPDSVSWKTGCWDGPAKKVDTELLKDRRPVQNFISKKQDCSV